MVEGVASPSAQPGMMVEGVGFGRAHLVDRNDNDVVLISSENTCPIFILSRCVPQTQPVTLAIVSQGSILDASTSSWVRQLEPLTK